MVDTERKAEQQHLDVLYTRLDELRVRSERALDLVRRQPTAGTPAARSERDAFVALHAGRLSQLRSVEERLCFGRLDLRDGERRYIGRIGLSDDEHEPLLVDWRAPAAAAVLPGHRRHARTAWSGAATSRTERPQVTGIEDEVLDLDAFDPRRGTAPVVAGEGALLAALDAAPHRPDARHRRHHPGRAGPGDPRAAGRRPRRPGRAGHRQDRGRAAPRRVPALHPPRAARRAAACWSSGPNPLFLRYIEQVLPSLGETGVVLATPGELYPGVGATRRRAPRGRRAQGRPADGRGARAGRCATASGCRPSRSR